MSIEETQKLPDGWNWTKLETVCDFVRGVNFDKSEVKTTPTAEHIPILRAGNIGNGLNITEDLVWVPNYCVTDNQQMMPGDITICMSSGSPAVVGKTAQLRLPWKGSVGAFCGIVRPKPIVLGEYLGFWFQSEQYFSWRNSQARGGGIQNLRFSQLAPVDIPLPPLSEQKRIAAILTEKMAAIEKARIAAEERLRAAKELPAAYLREVFESEEAKGWARKRMEDVAELLPSKSIATDGDSEVRAITTACLSEIGFLPIGIKSARMKSSDVPQCIVSAGEILIARSNTPDLVGRVAMFDGEPLGVVASDLTIRIMPNDLNNSEFLTSYLSFLYLTGYWKDRAGGASGSMKKITRGQILAEMIPVPSHEEQQRIIMRIKDKLSGVQKLIQQLQDELKSIKELPVALLRQAFAGAI